MGSKEKKSIRGVRPFLRWAGGKKQLTDVLSRHLPMKYGRYIEPFLGGGALFFHLLPKTAILGDSNDELILTYKVVRDNVEQLINALHRHRNSESYFYRIRALDPSQLSDVERAARLIYLNKTCFNGLYRVNKKGQFNVPFGHRTNPTVCDKHGLLAASRALYKTRLVSGEYVPTTQKYAKPGDFVYFDPPCHPVGDYSDFKRYTKEFFYESDHLTLRDEFARLVDLGCHVLLTNSNTGFTRELY